jgi:hypothetical protein
MAKTNKDTKYLAYRFRLGPTVALQTVGGRGQPDRVRNTDEQLTRLANTYNKVRNAMMFKWTILHKQVQNEFPDAPKVWQFTKEQVEQYGLSDGEQRLLYEAGRAIGGDVYADNYGVVLKEITTILKSRMPRDHYGEAKYKHIAIIDHEISIPSFRSLTIPVKNRTIRIAENGIMLHGSGKNQPLLQASLEVEKDQIRRVVVCFPLYANRAPFASFTLILHDQFEQDIIDGIRDGKCKIGDSKLVKNTDHNFWELHLSYSRDFHRSVAIEHADNPAYLIPLNNESGCPFALAIPCADGSFERVLIGNDRSTRAIIKDVKKLDEKAKTTGYYYRKIRAGGGHGRMKVIEKTNRYRCQARCLRKHMMRSLITKICKIAINKNCGTLVYLEPTKPSRLITWFSKQEISFEWSRFEADLASKVEFTLHHYKKEVRVRRAEFASDCVPIRLPILLSRLTSREVEVGQEKPTKKQKVVVVASKK